MKRHAPNSRSEFLSELMKVMGGDSGASIISAFKDNDVERMRHGMNEVADRLATVIEHRKALPTKKAEEAMFAHILKGGRGSGRHAGSQSNQALQMYHQKQIGSHQDALNEYPNIPQKDHSNAIEAHQAVIDHLKSGGGADDLKTVQLQSAANLASTKANNPY